MFSPLSTPLAARLNRVPAPLIQIVALVLIVAGAGFSRLALTLDNMLGFVFARMLLGGVILYVAARPDLRSLTRKQWRDCLLLGVVVALFNLTDCYALIALPLGLVATIGFLGPLAVGLTAVRRPVDVIWPLLGFAGVVLLAPLGEGGTVTWYAIGCGLVYALGWAFYILASAKAGRSMGGIDGFAIANLLAALMVLPFGFARAVPYFTEWANFRAIFLVTALAVVPLGLEFFALKRLSTRIFGVLLSLEPAIASIMGLILLGELLGWKDWLAISIVTIASIGATLFGEEPEAEAGRT